LNAYTNYIDTHVRTLQLASQVALCSKHLQGLGLRHGDRVVLSFPPGLEFFVAFLACITQGYIAGTINEIILLKLQFSCLPPLPPPPKQDL
jgi:acyl-CoA synthetase (AMP-forming)/AMP-acid ligase II